jgi:hypothetical protein
MIALNIEVLRHLFQTGLVRILSSQFPCSGIGAGCSEVRNEVLRSDVHVYWREIDLQDEAIDIPFNAAPQLPNRRQSSSTVRMRRALAMNEVQCATNDILLAARSKQGKYVSTSSLPWLCAFYSSTVPFARTMKPALVALRAFDWIRMVSVNGPILLALNATSRDADAPGTITNLPSK